MPRASRAGPRTPGWLPQRATRGGGWRAALLNTPLRDLLRVLPIGRGLDKNDLAKSDAGV
jgi:hypothetical protein